MSIHIYFTRLIKTFSYLFKIGLENTKITLIYSRFYNNIEYIPVLFKNPASLNSKPFMLNCNLFNLKVIYWKYNV